MQKDTHCHYNIKYPAQNCLYFQTASPLHCNLLSKLYFNISQNISLSKIKLKNQTIFILTFFLCDYIIILVTITIIKKGW